MAKKVSEKGVRGSCNVVEEIRGYLLQQKALGTDRLRSWVEVSTGRFTAVRPLGRPPRRL
jgi:putative transposase